MGLGDGHKVKALGTGSIKFVSKLPNNKEMIGWMHNALYVPKLSINLFSVRESASNGNSMFFGTKCWIRNQRKHLIGVGLPIGKLYRLDCTFLKSNKQSAFTCNEKKGIDVWHRRLAHVNTRQLRELCSNADGINIPSSGDRSFCEACIEGKMHRLSHHPLKEIKSTQPIQLIHSDVCGPMQTHSWGGRKYFITFSDDFSRYCRSYFMRHKSEALEKFIEFKATSEKESWRCIKALRADRGGDYTSDTFTSYLKDHGIRAEFTAAYSPQQNGVAERINRTFMEAVRAMMSQAYLSKSFWAEAVATATYLRNRMVTAALKDGLTPYQMWVGKKPDLRNIRTFGCMVYSHIPEGERRKLDRKAHKLRFVGYTESTSNYKVWDEVKRRCFVRHDLIFNEDDFGETDVVEKKGLEAENEESIGTITPSDCRQREDLSKEEQPFLPQCEVTSPQPQPESSNESQPQLRRSERSRKPPTCYGRDEFADKACHCAYQTVKIEKPLTIEEALSSNYSKEWKDATDAEYASLLENQTWDLVELPEGRRAIGCKWVLKLKYNSQGNVDRFKGRLVAQGYSQKHGID